jgi:two-component system, sensor histidine kinase PdtaS
VPSLTEVARDHTDLDGDAVDWLHVLIADWQIIADLSFADLVLWLPDRDANGYWGGAQRRPTTAPTAFVDDLVGAFVPRGRRPLLDAAFDEGRIAREGDPEWRDHVPVRVETIPVLRQGVVIGVVARNTNLLGVRTPSRLELSYLQTASDLTRMVSQGRFPYEDESRDWSMSPQVGDGFVRVDAAGVVTYASPNAQSVYHRLGLTRAHDVARPTVDRTDRRDAVRDPVRTTAARRRAQQRRCDGGGPGLPAATRRRARGRSCAAEGRDRAAQS